MSIHRGDVVEVSGGYFRADPGAVPIRGKVVEEPQGGVVAICQPGATDVHFFRLEDVTVAQQ